MSTKLNIVAIIPARSGSKGVPNKNIRSLGGRPLIEWSIAAAKLTPEISRVIVSTDSQSYAELAIEMGADAPFIRPTEISGDKSSDLELFKHVIHYFDSIEKYTPEIFVHLRPTSPFRDPDLISEAIQLALFQMGNISAIRSVQEMSETAYKTVEFDENDFLISSFSRNRDLESSNLPRQHFPVTYSPNGYVDIIFPKNISDCNYLHGSSVMGFKTDSIIEIDSENDFKICESLLSISPIIKRKLFGTL